MLNLDLQSNSFSKINRAEVYCMDVKNKKTELELAFISVFVIYYFFQEAIRKRNYSPTKMCRQPEILPPTTKYARLLLKFIDKKLM